MTQNPKPKTHNPASRPIILWLLLCITLVALMVLIGGYTRLSGSGLSITSWKPIHGSLPPLNDTQWQEEFTAYQASPQSQKINSGMSLDEFRTIFWPEFIHRLLGRLIGIVFFLPLAIFAFRRRIPPRLAWRLFGIFLLGGLQGLVGWLMVKSGLIDTPHVSPIRLAAHLSLAFAILGVLVWTVLDFCHSRVGGNPIPLNIHTGADAPLLDSRLRGNDKLLLLCWFTLLAVQIILGAFMAGTHAGLVYNTWPTMNGQWIPDDLWAISPWYNDITLIQFLHRKLAIILVVSYSIAWILARKNDTNIQSIKATVAGLLLMQFVLGITTLLYQAPLALALAHQITGMLLFISSVILLYQSQNYKEHD